MATRKKGTSNEGVESPNLSEILSDGNDSEWGGFASVDSVATLRLIYAVSALGGMVTFWDDRANKRVCFSVRLWGGHKSYQVDEPLQFGLISEPVVAKLTKYMMDKKLSPPPLLRSPEKPEKQ